MVSRTAVLLVLTTKAVAAVTFAYDSDATLRELELCEGAYCMDTSSTECPDCPEGITVTKVVTQGTSGGQAIVGYDEQEDRVFVAYRGSSNVRNWIENVKFVKTKPYAEYPDVSVEQGFYDWYTDLNASGVYDAVQDTASTYKTTGLKVTGHSAGGACATLFAFDAIRGVFGDLVLAKSTTFGSPRVGDPTFAATYAEKATFTSTRVTHYRDVVPHMPMEDSMGYHHIATEVFYADEASTYYVICDGSGEDDSCSNSCAPVHCTSVDDHLYYLNTTVGSSGCVDKSSHRLFPRLRPRQDLDTTPVAALA